MSSIYVACRANFKDNESADKFVTHINKVFLGKRTEEEKKQCLMTTAPRCFVARDGAPAQCWFKTATANGSVVDLQMEVHWDFFEDERYTQELARWLAGSGSRSGLLAVYFSGADENYEFYELKTTRLAHVYTLGWDPAIDEQLVAADGDLAGMLKLVQETPIRFKEDYRSDKEKLLDDLRETLYSLQPYRMFDSDLPEERSMWQLGLHLGTKSMLGGLSGLSNEQKQIIDRFLVEYRNAIACEVIGLLNMGGYQIQRDGVTLDVYFLPKDGFKD